jgi:hypothetical protein
METLNTILRSCVFPAISTEIQEWLSTAESTPARGAWTHVLIECGCGGHQQT